MTTFRARCGAIVAAGAAAAALGVTGEAAAAPPPIADVAIYHLPATPTFPCRIGVTNNGPATVQVQVDEVHYRALTRVLEPLAAGQSTAIEYTSPCTPYPTMQGPEPLIFFASAGPTGVPDPNPLNNVVLFGPPTPFGSS